MEPFDKYPAEELLEPLHNGDNARRGYGFDLFRRTNGRCNSCAYCGVSFVHDYYRWLLLQTDHVIPRAEGQAIGIRDEWLDSMANQVLCCSACNTFDNRFKLSDLDPQLQAPATPEEFYKLRDRVFAYRKKRILKRHKQEAEFFAHSWWMHRPGPAAG